MAKKLWGGRFSKKTNPLVEEFTKSISYDSNLVECDVIGSVIHVSLLKKSALIDAKDAKNLLSALQKLHKKILKGEFNFDFNAEDIHTAVQNALEKEVGAASLKLHTARSRNDQVLFDLKLFCKLELVKMLVLCEKLRISLAKVAKKNKDVIIPGYTHLQQAQLIYLSDYFESYREMLKRDSKRLVDILKDIKLSLGAGALSGTPIPSKFYQDAIKDFIKNEKDLKEIFNLGKDVEKAKSLDTVSNRDFVVEILSSLSIIGMHLSRLSEDLIIWSTKEFSFVELDDAYATGSSLMPQKKNPDVLELIRGYTGTLYGNLMSVLTMMKGLPLTYNRDMQLDKPGLFSSLEIVKKELQVLPGLIETLKWNKKVIEERAENDEALYATDLVYHLVKKGIPFKTAHDTIGKLVKFSFTSGKKIKEMTDRELKKISDKLKQKEIVKLLNPKTSVKSRISIGR